MGSRSPDWRSGSPADDCLSNATMKLKLKHCRRAGKEFDGRRSSCSSAACCFRFSSVFSLAARKAARCRSVHSVFYLSRDDLARLFNESIVSKQTLCRLRRWDRSRRAARYLRQLRQTFPRAAASVRTNELAQPPGVTENTTRAVGQQQVARPLNQITVIFVIGWTSQPSRASFPDCRELCSDFLQRDPRRNTTSLRIHTSVPLMRLQSLFRPVDPLRRCPVSELGRDLGATCSFFRPASRRWRSEYGCHDGRMETVRGFGTGIGDVDHKPLNSGGTISGPSMRIVTALK